jgi:hypothetical protein
MSKTLSKLVVLIVIALSLVTQGNALAQEQIPMLVNIRTEMNKKHVGEVLKENNVVIMLFDIVRQDTVTIDKDQIKGRVDDIDEKNASNHIPFATYAAWKLTKLLKVGKIQGNVAAVLNQNIFINLGKAAGVEKGQTVNLLGDAKVIRDPVTNEVLGIERPTVASGKIIEVLGVKLSKMALINAVKPVQVNHGMVAEIERNSVTIAVIPPRWKSEDPNLKTADEALFLTKGIIKELVRYRVPFISLDKVDQALSELSEKTRKPKTSILPLQIAHHLNADILINGDILPNGVKGEVSLRVTFTKNNMFVGVLSGSIDRDKNRAIAKVMPDRNIPIGKNEKGIPNIRKLDAFTSLNIEAGHQLEIIQGKSPSLRILGDAKAVSLLESSVEGGTLHLRWKSGNNPIVRGTQTTRVTMNGMQISMSSGSSTSVSNGSIRVNGVRIGPNQPVKPAHLANPLVLRLTVNDIRQITLRSSTKVTFKNLKIPTLRVNIAGSGNYSLAGMNVDQVDVTVHSSGHVYLSGMAAQQSINIFGSGRVDASRLMGTSAQVKSMGSGDTTVAVKKSLRINIFGSGDVSYIGDPTVTKQIFGSGTSNRIAQAD